MSIIVVDDSKADEKLAIVRARYFLLLGLNGVFKACLSPQVTETTEKEISLFAKSPGPLVNNPLLSQF